MAGEFKSIDRDDDEYPVTLIHARPIDGVCKFYYEIAKNNRGHNTKQPYK